MLGHVSTKGNVKWPPQQFWRRMSIDTRISSMRVQNVQQIILIREKAQTFRPLQYPSHPFASHHYGV